MLKTVKWSMANIAFAKDMLDKHSEPQIALIAQIVKIKCNSSPQRARRTQSYNPLNPPLLRGTPTIIPLSKGGKGGCYAISAFCGELNCYDKIIHNVSVQSRTIEPARQESNLIFWNFNLSVPPPWLRRELSRTMGEVGWG